MVATSKHVKDKPKPKKNIHEFLKENDGDHDKIPRAMFEYAVNAGKTLQPKENKGFTFIRKSMSKYPKISF